MFLKYFYDDSLAQASYMVGCQATGEAAIVDPSRNIEAYIRTAEKQGFTITAALETHIHADFVSGSIELSDRTGATVYHSAEGERNGGYSFPASVNTAPVRHKDTINIGKTVFEVLHTPGHTPEHISFLLTDGANPKKPIGIFTGDFVFVGDVGRPDLLEKSVGVKDSATKGASQMFESLKQFKQLDDYLQVWPGHGAGSSCGKALGAVPTTTVGYEKQFNPALQYDDEQSFSDFLLDGQPEPPAYFKEMKELNKGVTGLLGAIEQPVEFAYSEEKIRELAQDEQALVVDTRPSSLYSQGHLAGTINIPYPDGFLEWMGWLTDYRLNVYLIAEPEVKASLAEAFYSIGIDNVRGFFSPKNVSQAKEQRTYETVPPSEIKELKREDKIRIVDVRFENEWNAERIPGAIHVMLGSLQEEAEEKIPHDKPVAVHCASGKRSAIAASILLNKGYEVKNIGGGFAKWKADSLETEKP
ncbi:MBL fold metallo-hydrolase [Alteribacter lacisalsi]|uniref:MBL fold metallo-hydrolase n=1 Tax=Alteribacter lacisalsi TaxID=2045244 RepID=A0A2W0HKX5_9BACI|nr:MBL fold metallo-hydrolase [Alteribacter lacisalsi]PYZ97509.1 MBL fold metallo-hydrolase [Alteribacter lacisalsi]